jgi:hypothetical protein
MASGSERRMAIRPRPDVRPIGLLAHPSSERKSVLMAELDIQQDRVW